VKRSRPLRIDINPTNYDGCKSLAGTTPGFPIVVGTFSKGRFFSFYAWPSTWNFYRWLELTDINSASSFFFANSKWWQKKIQFHEGKEKKIIRDGWQLPLPLLTWKLLNTKSAIICDRFVRWFAIYQKNETLKRWKMDKMSQKWIVGISQCETINEGWTLRWSIR